MIVTVSKTHVETQSNDTFILKPYHTVFAYSNNLLHIELCQRHSLKKHTHITHSHTHIHE